MGEARRRRAARISTPPTNHEIEQCFRAIQAEGDGCYTLTIFSPFQALELLYRARSGDRVAHAQLDGVERMLELVERNSPHAPICLLCGSAFRRNRPPMLFGFVQAMRDDPTQMIANAICAKCCTKHPTIEAMERAITSFYRGHIISDLRVLPQPMGEAGHA